MQVAARRVRQETSLKDRGLGALSGGCLKLHGALRLSQVKGDGSIGHTTDCRYAGGMSRRGRFLTILRLI